MNLKDCLIIPTDDFEEKATSSTRSFSLNNLYQTILNLDPGGLLFNIVVRSVLAGWLAFLLKMYLRRSFPNVMFFIIIMFTLYSLIESNNSIKAGIKIAGSFYLITGTCYFLVNVLHPFPTLILLFFAVFSFLLIMICKLRLLAVFPMGYSTIFAATDQYGWLVGVNGCYSLFICFCCTLFVMLIFPNAQKRSVKSCIAKYLCELRIMFDRMTRGEQLEGEALFDYFRSHISLNFLIQKSTFNNGNKFLNISRIDKETKRRFMKMHELSRGLVLLRGFSGDIRDEFLKKFPDTLKMIEEFKESILNIENHILYKKTYDSFSSDIFYKWSQYYKEKDCPASIAPYQYAFSNLSLDLANAIENGHDENISHIKPSLTSLFSRTTKLWEALRFSLGMVIAYIILKVTLMPYGEWIGLFVAFIYAFPQHGFVFKRINKALIGTCSGVLLGFIFVETTMQYCYLWAYLIPILLLIFLYLFILKMDFSILMIAFAFFLMISLIMSTPLGSEVNFYQALASRMVASLIAALIVFFLELFSFHRGSVYHDIRESTALIFRDIGLSLEYCTKKFSNSKSHLENLDRTSKILLNYGHVAVMQSAIEFEIGYNPKMNKHYADFLKYLHITILYLKKIRYIARHNSNHLSKEETIIINNALYASLNALKISSHLKTEIPFCLRNDISNILKPIYIDPSIDLKLFLDSFILFSYYLDKTQNKSLLLTEKSVLFSIPYPHLQHNKKVAVNSL